MNDPQRDFPVMNEAFAADFTPCDRCGLPADAFVGNEALCQTCYQVAGSCCAGEESQDC